MIKKPDTQDEMYSQTFGKKPFEQAKSYAYAYMDGIHERNVFPTDEAVKNLAVFDEPFPAASSNAAELLRILHEYGSPATVTQTGGRYFGFVTGSSIPTALAAKWLADVWDQNAALYVMSPINAQLEATCEKWLVDLLGLPADTATGFVTGSSTANFCGLAAGRNELLKRQCWDVNVDGLFDAPKLRVVVGGQAHTTIFKALALLGLGKSRVEIVPTDSQGRMIADKMPELDSRCLVITQAGNVNSGAFDPIDEICDRARRVNAWVHVDGAFGLWAAGSRTKKILTQGIDKADSWAVDAHKTLNAPYDCGIILCKYREILIAAMQVTAAYIPHGEQRDGMQYTPEMSRRGRAVELWATLKFLGKDGVEELVDRLCDHAQRFADNLRAEGFRILNDVVFNQVLVACDSPEHTKATLENIQKSGECWCGGSVWNGEPAIRISVCSWATTVADVERSVAAFVTARNGAIFP
ncbi:MAG: aminotransferase class V-fold PLP-dependent enzyme [Methylobacter sp.]|nr:aminotransferase class V-fold PLP-dependent enzyme [Methylobacter sp.]